MNKVLVIVDMQHDFITGPLGNDECRAVVPKIADLLKTRDYDRVIFTMDTHGQNYLDTQEGKNLPVTHCIENTPGWKLVSEIADSVKPGTKIAVIKKQSFGSLDLGDCLKGLAKAGKMEIDFVGVCTGICVISNVMIAKAAVPETPINVLAECCACVTPKSHENALEAMRLCQVNII